MSSGVKFTNTDSSCCLLDIFCQFINYGKRYENGSFQGCLWTNKIATYLNTVDKIYYHISRTLLGEKLLKGQNYLYMFYGWMNRLLKF